MNRQPHTVVGLLGTLALLALPALAAAQQAPKLMNPGFEAPFNAVRPTGATDNEHAKITGDVANGWIDNSSWAPVGIVYGQERNNPHRGQSAQRIEIKSIIDGAVQFVQPVRVTEGGVYRFGIWMRGAPGTTLLLYLRQGPSPYTIYAQAGADLSDKWQQFEVTGYIPANTDLSLMLRSIEVTTFFVDDATFELVKQPSVVGKNLVNGGSFEADAMPYGWGFQGKHQPVIDKTTAAFGKQSLKIESADEMTFVGSHLLRGLRAGQSYTMSVWLKADKPDTPVKIQLERILPQQTIMVDTQWKRYTYSGTAAGSPLAWFNVYTRERGRTLWIDGVQLTEGAPPTDKYIAPYPTEMTLQLPDHPGNVVLDDQEAQVRVAIGPQLPAGSRLKLTMTDLYGRSRNLPDVKLPTAAFTLPVDSQKPFGVYTLEGTVVDGAGRPVSAPVKLVWSRLPHPADVDPDKSFFGMHIQMTDFLATMARNVGVRWVRLHDVGAVTNWHVVEPVKGQWRFNDEGVDLLRRHGLKILSVLGAVPPWATTNRSGRTDYPMWNVPDKPGAMEDWAEYVRKTVEHYKGRIDRWGVWNEPWGMFFADAKGTPHEISELTKIAYQEAKKVDPDAPVLGIEAQRTYPQWTSEQLKEMGTAYYDIFQYHDYNDMMNGGPDNSITRQVAFYNGEQARYGTVKPLINSEGGPYQIGSVYAPETEGLWPSLQPAQAVRFDVIQMANGVQQYYLYAAWRTTRMGHSAWQATHWDGSIKPVIAGRAVLASLIDGAGAPVRSEPVPGVDMYTFPAHNGRIVTVVWAYEGAQHTIPLARGQKVLDIMSNPVPQTGSTVKVSPEPIYLVQEVN